MTPIITIYDNTRHREPVISLWKSVFGYEASHNAPGLVIDKKQGQEDGLFFVAMDQTAVIGTVMAGYDGHRGWIYAMAVMPEYRGQGVGSLLLAHAENALSARGCMKINLQIVEGNEAVAAFYSRCGYGTEKRISMGKRLPENIGDTDAASEFGVGENDSRCR
ncbi:MAG: GNAT family acetyltransferase [Desulfobacterales bacterium]|nr:GNAT family acetyltransferase [Desulfobacterales bacterium]